MQTSASKPWEKLYPPGLKSYAYNPVGKPQNTIEILKSAIAANRNADAFSLVLTKSMISTMTFDEVDSLSDHIAAYFVQHLGLKPGDVVAIQLPNCLQYPITVLGAWKVGLIITNVNPLYTKRETCNQLTDSHAKVLIACDLFVSQNPSAYEKSGVPLIVASLSDFFPLHKRFLINRKMAADSGRRLSLAIPHVTFSQALKAGRKTQRPDYRHHPIALYQYTGGTTGKSKGAVLTHQNLVGVLRITEDFLGGYKIAADERDAILTALPMYHVFAFVLNFLLFFTMGARNVLIANPRPLSNVRNALESFSITWMTGVDTLFAGLLREDWFQKNPPKLKYLISGGTSLRSSTAEEWSSLVCPVLEGYGLTETSCIVAFHPPGIPAKSGSVGIPLPGVDVRLVDAHGNDVLIGEPGEVLVRGPHVATQYLHQPEESLKTFAGGWLHTGDIAVMDSQGMLSIVDRKKDMVIVSGFNVYPNEVESIIAEMPGVAEVAVIGVHDEKTGEAVKAVISLSDQALSEAAILLYCRQRLTAYKVPKQIEFREQLPKSPVGKILRAQLR